MIITIMPEYIEGIGDCCRIKRRSSEILHEKKLNTVFKEVFRGYCTDYCALKKITTNILKQKTLIPIYVSSWEILIPVKVRQPLFRGDCCYGYVNIFEIKKVLNKEILLASGEKIAFLDTKRAIQKRELMAETLNEKLPVTIKAGFLNAQECGLGIEYGLGSGRVHGRENDIERRCRYRRENDIERRHGYGRDSDIQRIHGYGQGNGIERMHWHEHENRIEGIHGSEHDHYPSMPEEVEKYILNLVYRAIEDKSTNKEALNKNKCS